MIERELRERAGSQDRLCDFPGDTIFSGHKDQGPMDQLAYSVHAICSVLAIFDQQSVNGVSQSLNRIQRA